MFASFWSVTGLLLVGKLFYEYTTGEILFVNADGFKPLVESHLSGAVLGAIFAAVEIVRRGWAPQTILE
ncbi:hypothetical protein RMSM_01323 [Rhodopirellula maiorica SM1]|uniref:Rhomboid family protein n=1 Tax=Rhodopirellula maiorica SM1 TaxID=1265738 RepID=M5S6D7_9BACT|nr:hypothetical protein RMSM_01323 [Rhodopirellula maiorica SM1]